MHNTVLGAKPLQPDGRAFYYSDYNFQGKKVYSDHRWPCCSGTLPQVTTDYRISAYFHDARGVWVNLYIPSTVRWIQDGAQVSLTQKSDYPDEEHIQFEVKTSKRRKFALNFRIPAWAEGAAVALNGKRQDATAGTFANVLREWKDGDRVELVLPMKPRLEAIDAQHSNTVAMMVGPQVLFTVEESQPAVTRAQLLAAKKMAQGLWHIPTPNSPMKMVTFTMLGDQPYTTYLRVT